MLVFVCDSSTTVIVDILPFSLHDALPILMAHGVIFVDYNQQGGPRGAGKAESVNWLMVMEQHQPVHRLSFPCPARPALLDRKSTRLNSSHGSRSYAVFCLEKKKKKCTELA